MIARLLMFTAFVWVAFVSSVMAEDTPRPVQLTPPITALARATRDGKVINVTLKLAAPLPGATPASGDGKSVGWREVTVKLGDGAVQVFDVAGQSVATERVSRLLEKETPVLVTSGRPDPFHLLTTKESTLIFSVPAEAVALPESAPSGPGGLTLSEKAVLDLANAERKKVQLAPLVSNSLLTKAARLHSANMAKQARLEHTLDEKTVGGRLSDAGYSWSRCGENIALGPRTPEEAISAWMSSPGHKENMLSREFRHIGVASATGADGQQYWTMVLASPLN